MNNSNLCVISTKNPNEVLLNTIYAIKRFYPEFDIVIVDSDSTNMKGFESVPSDVKIEYVKNKNWELGAWTYAYNKYNNYKIYMFIQDGLEPIKRINNFDTNTFVDGTLYSFHYNARIVDGGHLEELYDVYRYTNLHFLYGIDPETIITGTAHTSFITNNTNVRTILQMEDAYIMKNIKKTKVHSCLSERTGGLLAEIAGNKRIDIKSYFKKTSLSRD
jgi:hypothetical protein